MSILQLWGSHFTKTPTSADNYQWPAIPPAPKVRPNNLTMKANEYPTIPSFQLIIHSINKDPYIPQDRTKKDINHEIIDIAKEFELQLKKYLATSQRNEAYKIYYPCIKKTQYNKNTILLEFHGIITLGLIIQFIFLNRSINLNLTIKPINFNGKTVTFGFHPKLISKYINNIVLKQYHQGYKSERGYLIDKQIEDTYIDKVHFHCHFNESTHLIALNLYKLLIEHLNEYNCTIYSRSLLYQQNGPHICWNWQVFVLYPESIGRCIGFLMANIPDKKNIYFPFHSRTFDFVTSNRFIDHCLRVGWIYSSDPMPLYVDFFKDKLKEFIVPFPKDEQKISLEKVHKINNYWFREFVTDIDMEIHSFIYQYCLDEIKPYDIIRFWFGELKHNKQYCMDKLIPLWMTSKQWFDDEIRNKFGLIMDNILIYNNDYYIQKWTQEYTTFGLLAYVVMADQMTRNIYRGTKKAFMFDEMTQKLCLDGMDNGYFKWLFNRHPIYCWVFNLVFQHAEDITIVQMSIDNLKWIKSELHKSDPMYMFVDRDITSGGAFKHYKMIEKFGRYLQRDKILGRDTNDEEKQYLIKSRFNKMVSYKSKSDK
eukprot:296334_1